MNTSFPKDILNAMKDCILSIFWSKKEIVDFFKSSGCTSQELKKLNIKDLKRYEIIDFIFDKLQNRTDKGLGQFRSMLSSLIQWNYFNPYYFEKLKKLDKYTAVNKIKDLKEMQEKRDMKINEKNKEMRKREKEKEKSKTKDELIKKFDNLFIGKDENDVSIDHQKRGYLFEKFLIEFFRFEKFEVKNPFKIQGEQLDGAIKFGEENYVIEAKWKDKYTSSDALYQFAHKIEGKFYGRGIFISINGFSDESVRALKYGKSLNCILIDGADLIQVLDGYWTFKQMLEKKIQGAQIKGEIYLDVNKFEGKIK